MTRGSGTMSGMTEFESPPPKPFRLARAVVSVVVPLALLVVVLALAGIIPLDGVTVPSLWADLLLVVLLALLTVRAWLQPTRWLGTTYLGIIATGASRVVLAVGTAVTDGIGFAHVFWLLAGAAFLFIGWSGLQAARRGENPFAARRRGTPGPQ